MIDMNTCSYDEDEAVKRHNNLLGQMKINALQIDALTDLLEPRQQDYWYELFEKKCERLGIDAISGLTEEEENQ